MINFNFPLIVGKLIERKINEWKNAGRAEGIAEGYAEGVAEMRAKWVSWNNRRLDAERDGVPFLEPPPDDVSRDGLSEKERE